MNPERPVLKILTVDDTPTDVEILQMCLKKSGIVNEMAVMRTAEEGLAYLEGHADPLRIGGKNLPDLIFLDLKLPGENGLAAMRKIKSHPLLKRIPVIVYSSSHEHEDLVHSYRFGATYFLKKPYTESLLGEVMVQLKLAGVLKG